MIACLMVFTVHFSQRMHFEGIAAILAGGGKYGVYLFFIISGFLIANSCENYGRQHTGNYIVNRMIKILPLYYCVIAYYFVVHIFILRDIPEDPAGLGWLRYLFILNGIVPNTGTYFWDNLGITWTIPYFVWAYLCLPLVLKVVKNYFSSVAALFVTLIGMRYLYRLGGYFDILYNAVYFIEGVVIFYCFKERKQLVTVIGVVLLAVFYAMEGAEPKMLWAYAFMLLIIATEKMHSEKMWVKKVLELSDRYSYTMYLAHGVIFIHLLDRYSFRMLRPWVAILGTAVLTVFAHDFVEAPIQEWLAQYVGARRQRRQNKSLEDFGSHSR